MQEGNKLQPITIPDFLPIHEFRPLRASIHRILRGERVNIIGHKRGSTIAYDRLKREVPNIVDFYRSASLVHTISEFVGTNVVPTPDHDQSSCSALIYDRPGDRIGMHYDHNFYNGRHFTALLSLVNEHIIEPRLSSSRLLVRSDRGDEVIPTPRNTFVLFEGAETYHGVTPLDENEVRIVLSMTFCTDSATTRLKDFERRVKDVAYFGLRALRY